VLVNEYDKRNIFMTTAIIVVLKNTNSKFLGLNKPGKCFYLKTSCY
jgi:hypothetical protein